jgi:MoaA/NifB/PqqE/SkfB family radical SAM enzyme
MSVVTRVKEAGVEFLVDRLVALAAKGARKDPDRTLRRMCRLADLITTDPAWKAAVRGILHKLDQGHPGIGVARKFLTRVNPRMRSLIVRNLIVRETLLGPNRRHALEEELGFYPPSAMVISPSMYCPLRCYGCYAGSYPQDEQLSFAEVDDIIRQAKRIGIQLVVLSGGEPFAWKPLFDVFAAHRDVAFQVFTSGIFLDEATVDRIAELGNVSPAISCEGFAEETDRRRGPGAFERVSRAMDRLREAGVVFTFSATATRENLEVVTSERFLDYWIERGCLIGWYFIYMPIGRGPALELMPTPEQRVELSRRLKQFRASKPIVLVDFWNDGEYVRGCIAGGRKYFHINSRGDVEPCVFCHFATDNIREKPLVDCLRGALFRALRARQPYQADYRRPCVMIDNPEVLREVVAATDARPTHEGAETLVGEYAEALDAYAEAFGQALTHGPVTRLDVTV